MYNFFFSSLVTWNFYLEINENNFLKCCLLSPGNDIFQNFLDINIFIVFFSQQATWKFQLVLKWYIFVNSCKNIFRVCLWLNLGLHLVSWCSKKGWLKPLFPAVFWSLWILQAFSCTMAVYLLYLCLIPWCFSVSGVRRTQHPHFWQEADFDSSVLHLD